YVMRRLLRRAIRYAFDLGIEQNFLEQIVPVIADLYHKDFPEVAANRGKVIEVLTREEKIFRHTLRRGLKEFDQTISTVRTQPKVYEPKVYNVPPTQTITPETVYS